MIKLYTVTKLIEFKKAIKNFSNSFVSFIYRTKQVSKQIASLITLIGKLMFCNIFQKTLIFLFFLFDFISLK